MILSRRLAAVAIILALAALPFLFFGGPSAFAVRSLNALWNLGHAALFFLLAAAGLTLLPHTTQRPWQAIVGVLIGAALVAVGIEWAQGLVGREQSAADVAMSVAGAFLGVLLAPVLPAALGASRSRVARVIVAPLLVLAVGAHLAAALLDEHRARRDFPLLSGFTSTLELSRWDGESLRTREQAKVDEHDGAMRVEVGADGTGSFHLRYFPADWRGYRALGLRVQHQSTATTLTCRLNDLAHDLAWPHVESDHFEGAFPLDSGWQDVEIDLETVAGSLPTRRMDLAQMNGLTCILRDLAPAGALLVEEVRLIN